MVTVILYLSVVVIIIILYQAILLKNPVNVD